MKHTEYKYSKSKIDIVVGKFTSVQRFEMFFKFS